MKILILDDHEVIRLFLKQQVLKITPSATIEMCNNLDSARKIILDTSRIDFVICDLELHSGCSTAIPELCHKLKIPYMIYSSHVNKVLISELSKLQVNCYVSKTSGIDTLHKGIDSLLNNRKYSCPLVVSTTESSESYKETEKLILTKGQKSVLEVLAKGFNRENAAKILNLKMTTLNNHIARARELNDCENFEELLRRYRFWDLLN